MTDNGERIHHWALGAVSVIISGALALVCSLAALSSYLTVSLNDTGESTTTGFTGIMDEYVRAFEQFEQLVQLKIASSTGPEDIAAYLKSENDKLADIEGDDFDGVYLYYQGHYLYSWDTPLSEYEQNGYDATERPWYTGAADARGDIYFSVPYSSFANEYLLATISRLQPDRDTVIAYDIKLESVQKYVSQLSIVDGSTVLICDMDGNIIGSTNQAYEGGNFRASASQFDADMAEAQANLDSATAFERDKAQRKVDSLSALRELVSNHSTCLKNMTAAPGTLVWDLDCGMVGLAQGNGRYNTITLIPLATILPMILLLWGGLWVFFAIGFLFVENLIMRRRAVKELRSANGRLKQAVIAADAASTAKSQFLAQMSHEIRTPMNAVIGLTGIAKTETQSPEKVMEYLTKIEGSSRLLLGIINDVLDMSAIEGGKLKIESSSFDFRAMITNITTIFYGQASKKDIGFEVHLNSVTEEMVIGDELRVNQVLMNLLSNAVKFTPAGGKIDFTVLQASRSQGKVHMRFTVADTGCGMSEEMLDRLFKPFEQESASTARKYGGSGLGLSIAKQLVDMMGGSLSVQSAQGEGTSFTADIPFGIDEEQREHDTVGNFSNIRVLVVDDDIESCEYCAVLLERLGVRHDYVTTGEEALEALENADDAGDPYKMCLVDWRMPGMDGGELTQAVRESFGNEAAIIIVSAYDLTEVEDSAIQLGVNYFVPKPLFQSTLFNALMHVSNGSASLMDQQGQDAEYSFPGKRVLLAEDVVLNMEVAVTLLERVGIQVTCAEDGRQAVDAFKRSDAGAFDCILLDINMPVMDGYEAARAIRNSNHPDANTVPIYAMTANAFAEDVRAALNAGMDGHIAKPIETKVLYHTLSEAFKAVDVLGKTDSGTDNTQ